MSFPRQVPQSQAEQVGGAGLCVTSRCSSSAGQQGRLCAPWNRGTRTAQNSLPVLTVAGRPALLSSPRERRPGSRTGNQLPGLEVSSVHSSLARARHVDAGVAVLTRSHGATSMTCSCFKNSLGLGQIHEMGLWMRPCQGVKNHSPRGASASVRRAGPATNTRVSEAGSHLQMQGVWKEAPRRPQISPPTSGDFSNSEYTRTCISQRANGLVHWLKRREADSIDTTPLPRELLFPWLGRHLVPQGPCPWGRLGGCSCWQGGPGPGPAAPFPGGGSWLHRTGHPEA